MEAAAPSLAPEAPRRAGPLQTRPLSPALGIEMVDIDLSQPIDDATFAKILRCWHDNIVILFRDQNLSEADQVRFAERFGALALSHTKRYTTDNPAVMLISNIRENGRQIGALPDGEMQFHSDQCYQEKPAMASMLYAIEVPSIGGDTLFANAYMAYETLSDDIKRRLDGLKALHAYDYDNASMKRGTQIKEGVPYFAHPLVRTHPATGRKALYVNRLMTIAIEGLPEDESAELLIFLFAHQENPAFIYEHVWRVNDLLMWDNRCALHARTDFSNDERRLMRRVTVLGERPV
ncbi:MAG: TauD/TfdA dioxygenase family protein [Stellaceae bacterium]